LTGSHGDASEASLVVLAQYGEDAAFEELVRRRQGAVRGLLRRLSGSASLGDDLAQEAFVQAWKGLARLRTPNAFGSWLRQISVNVWLAHARRKRIPMDALDDTDIAGEERTMNAILRIDLETALARLRPPERLCLVLSHAEGMTHGEIVQATGLPLGTVKSHIARAAAKLRRWLERDTVKASR
jgi:RNA polymerase sigma factor (sigma-70 family)